VSERLEDGHGPETPIGDTVVHSFTRGYAEWLAVTAERVGDAVLRTDELVAVDAGSAHLFFNQAVLLRPVPQVHAVDLAASIVGFFGARPGGTYSVFSPWPVPELPGLTVDGHPPLMLRAPGGEAPAPPAGLTIREIVDADGVAAYERVVVDGFPLDTLQPCERGCAFSSTSHEVDGVRIFVGEVDGRAVSGAMSIASMGVNHVELVATLPDARGHGYGEAVTWAATLAAPEVPAVLIASDLGRPVYERMGYLALDRWTFLFGER